MTSMTWPDMLYFGTLTLLLVMYVPEYLYIFSKNGNAYTTIDFSNFSRGVSKAKNHHRMFRQNIFNQYAMVIFPHSGGHFMKHWGGECQGPCKIYMSVPW